MPENRGGPRAPTPGALYPNRTDMQAPRTPKGQDYGEAQASLDRQMAQPVAGAPGPSPTSPSGSPATSLAGLSPGEVPTLMDPSGNPNQPVTAGLPSGPGPGLEGMSMGSFGPQELSVLRGMYKRYQYEPIRRMIEQMEASL